MDTKYSPETGNDQPPPYSLTPSQPSSSNYRPSSLTSHLQAHLSLLPSRIRQVQEAQRSTVDTALLDHLVPIIESFLLELGTRQNTPPLATLTLVPATAVPQDAVLSGVDNMRRRGELGGVVRVCVETDQKGDVGDVKHARTESVGEQPWGPGREFTDWGRWDSGSGSDSGSGDKIEKLLWWRNEELARRLAWYLQLQQQQHKSRVPKPAAAADRSAVQSAVEQSIPVEKERRGWGWGWGRNRSDRESGNMSSLTVASTGRGPVAGGDVAEVDERMVLEDETAVMHVTAEEVSFRRENDLWIWESLSGFAIVVTVALKMQRSPRLMTSSLPK